MHGLLEAAVLHSGPASLWMVLSLAAFTLISEDLACIAAGLLVTQGALSFSAATAACFAGIFVGDLLLVATGRILGRPAIARAPLSWWITPASLRRAEQWIARRGAPLVLISRFAPGTRLPVYLTVGILRAPMRGFVLWFALACALWTPLLVGAAVLLGAAASDVFATWSSLAPALGLVALLLWVTVRLIVNASTWRGRRLLLSRWRRLTRWEFWPMWAVYPPVVAYIAWLALRHGSLTMVSAVNPAMGGAGGLCGESKSDILHNLAGAGERVARWCRIDAPCLEERVKALEAFMQRERLTFPIVLKPDVGERGRGVVIAHSLAQAQHALDEAPGLLIAQTYVSGPEFGVFYHRAPSQPTGSVLAITEKRLPAVVGDGVSTLEQLILADDRAVGMARFFLKKFAERLDAIPAAREVIALTELGTHCRGSQFLDGTHLLTAELLREIDRVSRVYRGFHFGRYDVRSPSVEAFRRGEFTVLELNGLSSEATSIYDPRHSVWYGWRMLCRQWRIAFSIAAENRAAGAPVQTWSQIRRLFLTRQKIA